MPLRRDGLIIYFESYLKRLNLENVGFKVQGNSSDHAQRIGSRPPFFIDFSASVIIVVYYGTLTNLKCLKSPSYFLLRCQADELRVFLLEFVLHGQWLALVVEYHGWASDYPILKRFLKVLVLVHNKKLEESRR